MKLHPAGAASGATVLLLFAACSSFEDASSRGSNDAGSPMTQDASSDGEAGPVTGTPCKLDPSLLDIPGNKIDEDCSGKADDDSVLCDGSLSLASSDPFDAAKAIGLCKRVDASGKAWGVIEAKYVLPDGAVLGGAAPVSWGVLPSFGVNAPPVGGAMLALSSGAARAANQAGYVAPTNGLDKSYSHALPSGFVKAMPACGGLPVATSTFDGLALELRLRVPANATSFSFAHQFFTSDYGDFVCSSSNDVFGVFMEPKQVGSADGNIVLDGQGGALTANATTLLRVCTPGTHNGLVFGCSLGTAGLAGTGFEGHGSTGWLKTKVPVVGGAEITLRFAIWDSGDHLNDSTVLIDAFVFSTEVVASVSTTSQ
jgi:hypothetical protein